MFHFSSIFGVELSPCRFSKLSSRLAATLVSLTLLLSSTAQAMLLDYEAYLGDTKVGEARVSIDIGERGYEIRGKAKSTGLVGLFNKWKSFFSLRGIFSFGKPVARAYEVTEKTGSKKKQIVYQGDQVHVTKNGEPRRPMPLPADTDFYSLLFLSDGCGEDRVVHDGKDVWRVSTRHNQPLGDDRHYCEFELTDEDNERSYAAVWIERIGELKVPVQIDLDGAMRGTFKLTDHALD